MKVNINGQSHEVKIGTEVRLKSKEEGVVVNELFGNKLLIRLTDTGETKSIFGEEIDAILKKVVEKAALSLLDKFWLWLKSKLSK
jgi:hypothetical protein